ncbi:phosphate:sodium symporter [Bacteroidota bacterium]|nr:phosphate:sodium symporter [Bacteroidota bacterium]
MEILSNILKLIGGVGLFLYAMYLIETAIRNLAGRTFKMFLQRFTKSKIKAIFGGAIVTGLLQSSSLVSLMVLSFVGAGVLTMKNALAVILGANLGTTLNSWVVATLGFKFNIDSFAFPAVGIAGLVLTLFGKNKSVKYFSYFLMGFGLLFMGISFMKVAVEAQVNEFDFTKYADVSLIIFLIIGFVITTLIQSSSATIAITLSALNAGAVTFPDAAAMVIGSEVGTTIKLLMGSVGGNSAKKQVAFGNFLFNIFTTLIAFIFLKQILWLIINVFHITDKLMGLVLFQSLINLFSIVLFFPVLNRFAKILEGRFKEADNSAAAFTSNVSLEEPGTAMDLLKKEVEYFLNNSMKFNLELIEIDSAVLKRNTDFELINHQKKFNSKTTEEKYNFLKQQQGEIQSFYIRILGEERNEKQTQEIDKLISSVRSCMLSTKCIHDIAQNIYNLKQSSKTIKYDFFLHTRNETKDLYEHIDKLMNGNEAEVFKLLQILFKKVEDNFSSKLHEFYKAAKSVTLPELDITTVINYNRELFISHKAMLMAVKDFLLNENQAKEFNEIPVYRT